MYNDTIFIIYSRSMERRGNMSDELTFGVITIRNRLETDDNFSVEDATKAVSKMVEEVLGHKDEHETKILLETVLREGGSKGKSYTTANKTVHRWSSRKRSKRKD